MSLSMILFSCSIDKYIPADSYYLKKVNVESTDENATKGMELSGYVKQSPNTKWFGLKVPMRIYSASNPSKSNFVNRTLRKIGEAPVLLDTTKVKSTVTDMTRVLTNAGYLHSSRDTLM